MMSNYRNLIVVVVRGARAVFLREIMHGAILPFRGKRPLSGATAGYVIRL